MTEKSNSDEDVKESSFMGSPINENISDAVNAILKGYNLFDKNLKQMFNSKLCLI